MRIRIKFTKNDTVKYLGHLDIMRSFQRFFNCAHVCMTYSEGFNPHQKMHFALPLGVGILSLAEYLDAEVADGQDVRKIREDLDRVSGTGFSVLEVRQLMENAEKAMAAVRYASYELCFAKSLPGLCAAYLNQPSIVISKKTKTGIREVNVKELILQMTAREKTLYLFMKTGSENSIKPELIAQDYLQFCQEEFRREEISICRKELYASGMIPLISYQTL